MRGGTTKILFNADDRIVRVDPAGAEGVPEPGTELTDYIGSEERAALYRQLFAAVRNSRPKISLLARSDDPDARAVVAIELTRYGNEGHVEFRSSLVTRNEPKTPSPDAAGKAAGDVVVLVCSWCNRVGEGGRWIEIETFVEHQGWLVSETPRVQFTHGLCPSCSGSLRATAVGKSDPLPSVDT